MAAWGRVERAGDLAARFGIGADRGAVERVGDRGDQRARIGVARILEGLARHASLHAAGVLIAPGRLDEMVPLFKSGKGEVSTQWDMKSVEKVGLLKMDFLGLRTLTVIEDALDHIRERTGTRPDLRAVPLDDAATFDLLRRAGTVAVFQLESSGMRDLLRRLPFQRPDHYDTGELLGTGGQARVFFASDLFIGRDVALKEMLVRPGQARPDCTTDTAALTSTVPSVRFLREARITGQLEHPNIVPVHELAMDRSGKVFFTMKMVKGESLEKVLRRIAENDRESVDRHPLSSLLEIFLKV